MAEVFYEDQKVVTFGDYVAVVQEGDEVRKKIKGVDGKYHTAIEFEADGEAHIKFEKYELDGEDVEDVEDSYDNYEGLTLSEARDLLCELKQAVNYLENL